MKRWSGFAALLTTLVLTAGMAASCSSTPAVKNTAELESAIQKCMKTMNCPGAVFAVTAPGRSDVIITKGVDDLETKTKISTADNFRIGSITKTFTAIVTLQCQIRSACAVKTAPRLSDRVPQPHAAAALWVMTLGSIATSAP